MVKIKLGLKSTRIGLLFAILERFFVFLRFFSRFFAATLKMKQQTAFILANTDKSSDLQKRRFLEFSNQNPQKKYLYVATTTQDRKSCLRTYPNNSNLLKPYNLSPLPELPTPYLGYVVDLPAIWMRYA